MLKGVATPNAEIERPVVALVPQKREQKNARLYNISDTLCDISVCFFVCLFFGLDICFKQGKVAQTACMSACQHLSTSLMQMLLDSELKQISMGAIQQFNLDVIQCECKYLVG